MGKRALVVIDMQRGVRPRYQEQQTRTTINRRLDWYHDQHQPVILVQHGAPEMLYQSTPWQLVAALHVSSTDYRVRKTHADSFYKTELAAILNELTISDIEICGAEVPFCVDATIKAGFDRGYRLWMVPGAVSMVAQAQPLIPEGTLLIHYAHIWWDRFLTFVDE